MRCLMSLSCPLLLWHACAFRTLFRRCISASCRPMKQRYHYNVANTRVDQHVEKGNDDGLYISSVACCQELWALIMDAGTGFSSQVGHKRSRLAFSHASPDSMAALQSAAALFLTTRLPCLNSSLRLCFSHQGLP